jgi:hypothetical protein
LNDRKLYRVKGTNYFVSRRGNVWSKWFGKLRKLKPGRLKKSGHLYVNLRVTGKPNWRVYVHHLILTTFVGPCPPGMECRHKDGNPANNRADNLRWGTRKQNMRDKIRHGTNNAGENSPITSLTLVEVKEMRRLHDTRGWGPTKIARKMKRPITTVDAIIKRRNWKYA